MPRAFSRGSNVFGGAVADAIGSRYFSGVRRYYVVNASFGAVVAVLDGLLLWALGIPVPITWAILAFVTNFIPNIGFVIGLIPPAVLALVIGGWPLALVVVLSYSAINVVLQEFVQPKFVSDAVGLSLTLTFFSVVFWTLVLGPMGALLCIPLTLLVRALCSTPTRGRGRSGTSPAILRHRTPPRVAHRPTANPRVRRGFTRDSGAGSGAGSSLQTHDRGGTDGGVRIRPGRAVSRRIRGGSSRRRAHSTRSASWSRAARSA